MNNNSNRLGKMKTVFFALLMMTGVCVAFSAQTVVKVDFNMTGRPESEVNEPGYTAWPVAAAASTTMTVSGITFTLTYAGTGGTNLTSNWYKAGVQSPYYARLVDDCITVENGTAGAEIRMTIAGLAAGSHTLLTYHNNVDNPDTNTFSPIDIYVDGSLKTDNLVPTVRATATADARTSYLSFNATSGQSVVIRFVADPSSGASNKNVVINGFELDVPNPASQASAPLPENNDEHVNADAGSVTLRWTGASAAVSHDVYVGASLADVANATRSSSLFKGNQSGTSYTLTNMARISPFYWRIDEVASGGTTTKGSVWFFRPRQIAFPGAEGYGRYARGGRGGAVVHVTNLNDSGTGSLRAAIENNDLGPRTIVFDVAGMIVLNSRLSLNGKYVTVAGQTAPGKGICIRSAPFGMSGAQDAVIRNVRVRLGGGATFDGMGMAGSDHCIIDHCSVSWTIDEAFSSRNGKNITLQRTLISEALNIAGHVNYPAGTKHGYAATIGGDVGSFHHNLLAHCEGRNWSLGGGLDANAYYAGRLDIFNNVVYNWGGRATDGGTHECNFVGNYYKKGAATTENTVLKAQLENTGLGTQSYYYAGNIVENTNGTLACDGTDNACSRAYELSNGNPAPSWSVFVGAPFFPSNAAVQTARDAYKNVLSDVGCIQPVFDDHDLRVVTETRNGTYTYTGSVSGVPGLPDKESDVGGYESYPTTAREAGWDSDSDGLPNWWETYYGLNANSGSGDYSDTNADADNDGYTNMDLYLQWMAKPHYIIDATQTVSVNLGQAFMGYSKSPSYAVSGVTNGAVTISSGTAKFTPSACGMASFTLTVNDSEGASMTKEIVVFVNGSCSTTVAPTALPTTAPTSAPGAKGDVNSSGTVDIVDALLVAQYYVGLNPANFSVDNADVNCSGTVDIVDALLIAQYYVGLINAFC